MLGEGLITLCWKIYTCLHANATSFVLTLYRPQGMLVSKARLYMPTHIHYMALWPSPRNCRSADKGGFCGHCGRSYPVKYTKNQIWHFKGLCFYSDRICLSVHTCPGNPRPHVLHNFVPSLLPGYSERCTDLKACWFSKARVYMPTHIRYMLLWYSPRNCRSVGKRGFCGRCGAS